MRGWAMVLVLMAPFAAGGQAATGTSGQESEKPVQASVPLPGVERIGGAVSAPKVLYQPEPEFSEQARHDKVGGNVLVYLQVDELGEPGHVRVLRGVGYGLDEKAVDAVKAYKFEPAMKDGKPVRVEMTVQVNFQIEKRGHDGAVAQPKGGGGVTAPIVGTSLTRAKPPSPPVVLYQPEPEYTEEARREKIRGNVLVYCRVDEAGLPTEIKVLRGLGHGLDEKAVEAVSKYRFRPSKKDGQPVKVEINIEVNFQLF